MYFSFTTVLVKTDLSGNIIGTVVNLKGHLGDLDFNGQDGRVYGSFEFKTKSMFYIAVFDVEKIDKENIDAQNSDILKVIPLPEVSSDYTDSSSGKLHKYGCSGIDGVSFGPDFGEDKSSEQKLMVAYGIFSDTKRTDNDHQIILSFDLGELRKNEIPFSVDHVSDTGAKSENRYFVYTGNTNYGVQNLEYDENTGYWFMAVYIGAKTQFPNYALFAVDGNIKPEKGNIAGMPSPESGLLLPLAKEGLTHKDTLLRGWYFSFGSKGLISLGNGYFYISHDEKNGNLQNCTATLYRWVGGTSAFKKVN